jgi:FeS assembly SUF system protein
MSSIKEDIIEALKEVYDPEIPINVYDLGLIYDVIVDENNDVNIVMTLTSPTCPTADYLKEMIKSAAEGVIGVNSVEVELTFEPRWTPERVSDYAKEELGLSSSDVTSMASVQHTFSSDSDLASVRGEEREMKVCFNCGISSNEKPILQAEYKKESILICTSCISKF